MPISALSFIFIIVFPRVAGLSKVFLYLRQFFQVQIQIRHFYSTRHFLNSFMCLFRLSCPIVSSNGNVHLRPKTGRFSGVHKEILSSILTIPANIEIKKERGKRQVVMELVQIVLHSAAAIIENRFLMIFVFSCLCIH